MQDKAAEKELTAGDFVTNGVRLLRPLAEGGMGRVWIAEHLGLRTEVVVKLMAKEMMARPDGATRFAREAAIAAAINSPHVVQVFDHGMVAGHDVPYIVMERLDGKDLGHVLAERGRLEPDEAAGVVVQIGKALAKAHKAGIVHRDIKPENIFLCTPEADADADLGDTTIHAKLLDFGTAKRDQHVSSPSATLPGEIMGTPYYMSPEQSVGAMLDERTDIWSLGVVAFEALTGQKPFEGTNVGAIALAIHGATPKMSDRVADLPPALDAWFARACAQVPQDRFATMREMTSAFVEALTGSAPNVEATEAIAMPPRRISVRPQAASSGEDMHKTMVTSIEPSHSEGTRAPAQPKGHVESLAASLPDRAATQRPAKIAAAIVGLLATGVMAGIVIASRAPSNPPSQTTTTQAALPPPAPSPLQTQDIAPPPAPVDVATAPPAAAHKKTAHSAAKKHAPPAATKKDDDADLTRLIKAGDAESAPPAAPPVAPPPAPPTSAPTPAPTVQELTQPNSPPATK